MKLKTFVLIIAALVIFPFQSALAQTRAELKKITDSVYSYVGVPAGTPGNAFSANAGIIIGNDAVLVVDTLTSAEEAEAFFADIQKITNKPIRYAVNTHYHLDHSLGNSFFADRGSVRTSLPPSFIVPEVGESNPVSIFIVVVLPAPLGPRKQNSSPLGTSRSRPSTAFTSANFLCRMPLVTGKYIFRLVTSMHVSFFLDGLTLLPV